MIIHRYFEPFPYLVLDDYYSRDELTAIHRDIVELKPHARAAEYTGSGTCQSQ